MSNRRLSGMSDTTADESDRELRRSMDEVARRIKANTKAIEDIAATSKDEGMSAELEGDAYNEYMATLDGDGRRLVTFDLDLDGETTDNEDGTQFTEANDGWTDLEAIQESTQEEVLDSSLDGVDGKGR